VRLGDVTVSGRVRVDAIARYLQDIARDDSADSGLPNPMAWVVRRTLIEVRQAPVFQERVELATWCSGVGARWAERRTTVAGEHGGLVETATIWVHVDPDSGRPARLGPEFAALYGDTAAGRKVDARLAHPAEVPPGAVVRPWLWRATDFDVLAHVNNAAYAATVEEALAADTVGPATIDGCRVELEYRDPALLGSVATWALAPSDDGLGVWVLADDRLAFTARLDRDRSGSLHA
jgi:acyl-ACP thioesterase